MRGGNGAEPVGMRRRLLVVSAGGRRRDSLCLLPTMRSARPNSRPPVAYSAFSLGRHDRRFLQFVDDAHRERKPARWSVSAGLRPHREPRASVGAGLGPSRILGPATRSVSTDSRTMRGRPRRCTGVWAREAAAFAGDRVRTCPAQQLLVPGHVVAHCAHLITLPDAHGASAGYAVDPLVPASEMPPGLARQLSSWKSWFVARDCGHEGG